MKSSFPKFLGTVVVLSVASAGVALALGGSDVSPDRPDAPPLVLQSDHSSAAGTRGAGARSGLDDAQANYRAAAARTTKCMARGFDEAIGKNQLEGIAFTIDEPRLTADRFSFEFGYQFTVAPEVDVDELDENILGLPSKIEQACRATHLDTVETTYRRAYRSDRVVLREAVAIFNRCLKSRGGSLSRSPRVDDVRELIVDEMVRIERERGRQGASSDKAFIAISECATEAPSIFDASEHKGE